MLAGIMAIKKGKDAPLIGNPNTFNKKVNANLYSYIPTSKDKALIIKAVANNRGATRMQIKEQVGINKTAVSLCLVELIEDRELKASEGQTSTGSLIMYYYLFSDKIKVKNKAVDDDDAIFNLISKSGRQTNAELKNKLKLNQHSVKKSTSRLIADGKLKEIKLKANSNQTKAAFELADE